MIKSINSVAFAALFGALMLLGFTLTASAAALLPEFDADNFSNPTVIDNPWFSLPVGREFEYQGETEDGEETIEIEITGDTKLVNGIEALVYRDIVWIDGEIVEDTFDYLAQDDDGNVWYLGEDVDNYEDGEVVDHDGSWLAGVDGALPGYWMKANPKVGDYYKQEFYEGEAEDEGKVLSTSEKVKIGLGTYHNCLKIQDIAPDEPEVIEYKYYCKDVGGLVLEEKPEEDERIELVEYETEDGLDEDEDEDEDELAYEEDDDDDEDNMSGKSEAAQIRALKVRLLALLQQLIAILTR